MTAPAAFFAAAALLPAMTGPPASSGPAGPLAVALCQGGSMTLGFGGGPDRAPATAPCCAKGCHSRSTRRRIERRARLNAGSNPHR